MLAPLAVTASESAQRVLSRIGRTEDVRFSPDNRRLAVAGFAHDAIYVFDVEVDDAADDVTVALHGVTELLCPGLSQPHGLAFLGDSTLVVANRTGEAVILGLPQSVPGVRSVEAVPLATIAADEPEGVSTPGSVAATQVATDLFEVLVCNNYVHRVTRHLVDLRHGCRVLSAEVIASSGLQVPDGVAVSRDRRWIAISNHLTHSVLMFDRATPLDPCGPAAGVLRNVNYPHGLTFSGDDRHLVVADAGAPYLHIFARGADDWTGGREPIATLRQMDDDTFLRGRYNTQEGGPKGVDIDRTGRILAVTSEHKPLVFYDMSTLVTDDAAAVPSPVQYVVNFDEAGRELLLGALLRNDDLVCRIDRLTAEIARLHDAVADATTASEIVSSTLAERESTVAEVEAKVAAPSAALDACRLHAQRHIDMAEDRQRRVLDLEDSTSWRATAPLRWASGVRQRFSGRQAPPDADDAR